MKALLTIGLLASHAISMAQSAPTEKQAAQLAKIHETTFKPLIALLNEDKTGQAKSLKTDLDALCKEQDHDRRREMVGSFHEKHAGFYKKTLVAAKIDLAAYKRNIAAVLGNNKFTVDDFGSILAEVVLPQGPPLAKFTAEFVPPLITGLRDETSNGLVGCNATTGVNEIMSDVGMAYLAGSCRVKTSVGNAAELTAGPFSKITVSARSNEHYWAMSASTGGYSQCNVRLGLRLNGSGIDKVAIVKESWCIAPLFWVAEVTHDANDHLMQATFNGNFAAGSTLAAEVYAESFVLSALFAPAGGYSECTAIDFVRFTANN